MPDIIRQLPDTVANQIAAGEVVQRPASALKELVENAVDAGATDIKIVIKDAGRTLLQVVDDGKGMSHNDARMAFERHATSKIKSAEDLSTLHTMGFRGEALASICAISQVELRTCQRGETLGTRVIYSGGHKEMQEPVVCSPGTNIMVRNLFFNVPARRKFLRSDSVELGVIMREFEKLALVNNHLRMSIDTGTRVLELRAGSLKQRIGEIWKNSLDMHLLPVNVETSLVKIEGFVSRPQGARRRNPLQFLIVNGRNMSHPYFRKAILSCYEKMIAEGTQPNYFLKFDVDPATIDVNISPTKSEIKFVNEQEIRAILVAAIRGAMGKYGATSSIDFDQEESFSLMPPREGDVVKAPGVKLDPAYNPFRNGPERAFAQRTGDTLQRQGSAGWENLYRSFMDEGDDSTLQRVPPAEPPAPLPGLEQKRSMNHCIQCAGKYIITADASGMIIIDQHRAHVNILYDRYMQESGSQGGVASQQIMFPEIVELDATQEALLDGLLEPLMRLGFHLEKNAEGLTRIHGIPATLKQGSARDVLYKVLDSVGEEGVMYGKDAMLSADDMRSRVALVTARAAAIQRGYVLSTAEMESMVSDLFELPDPLHTPSGNTVFVRMDSDALAKLF